MRLWHCRVVVEHIAILTNALLTGHHHIFSSIAREPLAFARIGGRALARRCEGVGGVALHTKFDSWPGVT